MQNGALIEVLVRILVNQMCFLELCSDDDVNPDAACQQMEGMMSELQVR